MYKLRALVQTFEAVNTVIKRLGTCEDRLISPTMMLLQYFATHTHSFSAIKLKRRSRAGIICRGFSLCSLGKINVVVTARNISRRLQFFG